MYIVQLYISNGCRDIEAKRKNKLRSIHSVNFLVKHKMFPFKVQRDFLCSKDSAWAPNDQAKTV